MTNFISYNPFEVLNGGQEESEREMIRDIETTGPQSTSTPKSNRKRTHKKGRRSICHPLPRKGERKAYPKRKERGFLNHVRTHQKPLRVGTYRERKTK